MLEEKAERTKELGTKLLMIVKEFYDNKKEVSYYDRVEELMISMGLNAVATAVKAQKEQGFKYDEAYYSIMKWLDCMVVDALGNIYGKESIDKTKISLIKGGKKDESGISYDGKNRVSPYRARVYRNGKTYYVGRYKTKEEAIEARNRFIEEKDL